MKFENSNLRQALDTTASNTLAANEQAEQLITSEWGMRAEPYALVFHRASHTATKNLVVRITIAIYKHPVMRSFMTRDA